MRQLANRYYRNITGSLILRVWALLPLLFLASDYLKDRYNNYKIFRQVFYHLTNSLSLYVAYPSEYHDVNHYGPLFAVIIAPFALLPDIVGVSIWNLFNALVLYFTVTTVIQPAERSKLVLALITIEMANAMWSCQFNSTVAAMILLSYHFTEQRKEIAATFFIAVGTLVKLYGIVGVAFFLFSKNKKAFILALVGWSALLFILPMLLSSPSYVANAYGEWFHSIAAKNLQNIGLHSDQDLSVNGFVRRVFKLPLLPSWPFILMGLLATAVAFFKKENRNNHEKRILLCALVLMFPVLFSSSAEHPTFIIPMLGAACWLSNDEVSKWKYRDILIILLLVFAGLGPTDLFGKGIRYFMTDYSLKVIPFFLVWLLILYQLVLSDRPKIPYYASS